MMSPAKTRHMISLIEAHLAAAKIAAEQFETLARCKPSLDEARDLLNSLIDNAQNIKGGKTTNG